MSLRAILQEVLHRFWVGNPNAPASRFVFGFIAPQQDSLSISFNQVSAQLVDGIRDAEYLLYGEQSVFEALFNIDTPNRAEVTAQLRMKPDYPYNNYLLSIFLNTFDLAIPDLDYTAKRFDGPFPFPPRYPAAENRFRLKTYETSPLPIYNQSTLPELLASDHPEWVSMYHKAWQLAFKNLRQPELNSGFIANFIDPAFNANTFMWDSCFMMLFGCYARQQFDFMGTLDNFYARQHDDGFICREINTYSGTDLFQSLDPRSTGPNILAWTEWLNYQHSGNTNRLGDVFPALVAYHRWWKDWRTHPDGSYWTSGWGSGMDNQTRIPHSELHHRHYAWVDATVQQALSCRVLLDIANVIGWQEFNAELETEYEHLSRYINTRMWDETTGFYYDVAPDGRLSQTKSIGAYWGLLAGTIPPERAAQMAAHLEDPLVFNRPHRIPTQAYDSDVYDSCGGYWLGAVWSPTNYMVLRGLTESGYDDLAYAIARNHIDNVSKVYTDTGTLWENYAPEYVQPGKPAGKDFVGWTGLSAITMPIEYRIGLRPLKNASGLLWDIRLTERHGVLRYPLGTINLVDLICEKRASAEEPAILTIRATHPFQLTIRLADQLRSLKIDTGIHTYQL